MDPIHGLARSAIVGRASRLLAALSTVALIVMMSVTFVSVVMRYVFAAPILGSNEIIQMVSVGLVMLAMPYATQTEGHVRVDVLDPYIGRWGRYLGDLVARGLTAYVLWVLLLRTQRRFLDSIEFGDTTNMLQIPVAPAYGFIYFGIALYLLVLLLQVVDLLRTGPDR